MFKTNIYVRCSRDHIRVRNVESGREGKTPPSVTFTTKRLLIGDFGAAERALKEAVASVNSKGLFRSMAILIQQTEMNEGGLAPVESRVLSELALGAGAAQVRVWDGAELSDAEVLAKLAAKVRNGA